MDEAHTDLAAAHDHAAIDRHIRAALFVFLCLLVLTGFTVTAWTLHLPTRWPWAEQFTGIIEQLRALPAPSG